jgi:hypothetical protein
MVPNGAPRIWLQYVKKLKQKPKSSKRGATDDAIADGIVFAVPELGL